MIEFVQCKISCLLVKDPDDVRQRYSVLLKCYKKCRSLMWTAERFSTDPATNSNAAIAAPDVSPPPQGQGQALLAYANSVKQWRHLLRNCLRFMGE